MVKQLWHYLISSSDLKEEQTKDIVIAHIPEEYRSNIMNTVERLKQAGALKAQHNAVIEALEVRFDRVPEGLREAIQGINDPERLRNLHRAAIRCASIEEFSHHI